MFFFGLKNLCVRFVQNKKHKFLKMDENEISYKIIGTAIELHKTIGPDLLESVYETALAYDLRELGFDVKQQVPRPFIYKNIKMETGFRMDLLVEDKVIIEIKCVEKINDVHLAQTLTYLKLSNKKLGLIINFRNSVLKNGGIKRIINNLDN